MSAQNFDENMAERYGGSEAALAAHRDSFESYLKAKLDHDSKHHVYIRPRQAYDAITTFLLSDRRKDKIRKTKDEYYYMKNYMVIQGAQMRDNNRNYLVAKADFERAKDDQGDVDLGNVVRMAAQEDVFDIILQHHLKTDHAAGRTTWTSLKKCYSNISREICDTFVKFCACKVNPRTPSRPDGSKPILSKTFNDKGQVDLIDMQSQIYEGFAWILQYQDHHTKFSYLRALKNNQPVTVAQELISIWCIQGAPMVLLSDNGREFVLEVIKDVVALWPGVKIVHGHAGHPELQGSVEKANQDIPLMLEQWMTDNKTKNWPLGLNFVQIAKNTKYHAGVRSAPYILQYGQSFRYGAATLPVDKDVLAALETEEQLDELLGSIPVVVEPTQNNEQQAAKNVVPLTVAALASPPPVVASPPPVVASPPPYVANPPPVVASPPPVVANPPPVVANPPPVAANPVDAQLPPHKGGDEEEEEEDDSGSRSRSHSMSDSSDSEQNDEEDDDGGPPKEPEDKGGPKAKKKLLSPVRRSKRSNAAISQKKQAEQTKKRKRLKDVKRLA